jgi:hypothetical protein
MLRADSQLLRQLLIGTVSASLLEQFWYLMCLDRLHVPHHCIIIFVCQRKSA